MNANIGHFCNISSKYCIPIIKYILNEADYKTIYDEELITLITKEAEMLAYSNIMQEVVSNKAVKTTHNPLYYTKMIYEPTYKVIFKFMF